MNLIQNSIIVLFIAILFKGFLFMNDVKSNPSNPDYSSFYGDFKYEVSFKREVMSNDSLYYLIEVMDSKYKESDRVVTKIEYDSFKKGDVITERKANIDINTLFYGCGGGLLILGFSLFLWASTHKSFVLFSLKDFEE